MIGRNDPCQNGNKRFNHQYFSRIVNIAFLYNDLDEKSEQWLVQFKEQMFLIRRLTRFNSFDFISLDQPIPQKFLMDFLQSELISDLPMLFVGSPKRWNDYHLNRTYCDQSYTCKELSDIREENILFQSCNKAIEPRGKHLDVLDTNDHLYSSLNRFGNGHELINPYTSFVHEMRGEILVQLEKYNRYDEDRQDYTTRNSNGWRVLGWSIKREKELEKIEKIVVSQDMLDLTTQPSIKQDDRHQAGLSDEIMGHFEQFFMTCVSPLQERTQTLYGRSMELLYQYLSVRFGHSFRWSMVDEETLIHFLSVWYLDQCRPSPVASKVFLNTCKRLFRWLSEENISDVYEIYKRVYVSLIRALPITIEARKWMKINGVNPKYKNQPGTEKNRLYQLTTSSSGPVVFVDKKWVPIKMNGFPPMWSENIFWVRGSVVKENGQWIFTNIENVYPFVPWAENQAVMSHP